MFIVKLSTRKLFGLWLDSFTILIKTFRTALSFLSFKILIHSYLVETSMTHNDYLTFLFFEDNESISTKSAAQLSLNLAYIFLHLSFLTSGSFSSLVSCSFALTPDLVFLSKNVETLIGNAL